MIGRAGCIPGSDSFSDWADIRFCNLSIRIVLYGYTGMFALLALELREKLFSFPLYRLLAVRPWSTRDVYFFPFVRTDAGIACYGNDASNSRQQKRKDRPATYFFWNHAFSLLVRNVRKRDVGHLPDRPWGFPLTTQLRLHHD